MLGGEAMQRHNAVSGGSVRSIQDLASCCWAGLPNSVNDGADSNRPGLHGRPVVAVPGAGDWHAELFGVPNSYLRELSGAVHS